MFLPHLMKHIFLASISNSFLRKNTNDWLVKDHINFRQRSGKHNLWYVLWIIYDSSSPHHMKQPKWLFAKQDNLWDLDLDIHFWPFTKNACLRCGLFSSCNAIVELIHIPIDTIWCRAKIKKPPPPPPFSVSLSVLNYCYFVLILFFLSSVC